MEKKLKTLKDLTIITERESKFENPNDLKSRISVSEYQSIKVKDLKQMAIGWLNFINREMSKKEFSGLLIGKEWVMEERWCGGERSGPSCPFDTMETLLKELFNLTEKDIKGEGKIE